MIKNQWYGILEAREVKKGRPAGVTRLGEKLVLWRDESGLVHCISDQCCHRGAALSAGQVCQDHVCCPFHGFVYDASGKVVQIPANGKNTPVADRYRVNAWQVAEQDGFIWLWTGDYSDATPEIPFLLNCVTTFLTVVSLKSGRFIIPAPLKTSWMSSICLLSTPTPSAVANEPLSTVRS